MALTYKEILFKCMDAVGEMEGTYFIEHWGISEDAQGIVEKQYKEWKTSLNEET